MSSDESGAGRFANRPRRADPWKGFAMSSATAPAPPLAGIKVVELAGIGPAPFACTLLAELGAQVVTIDRPGGGGPIAALSPGLMRSRPAVAVDLKSAEGAEAVRRLVDSADVLVEGLRPGVTERLGLGPDESLARNPRLVYARMTGWGQSGPLAQRAGHDISYLALTGMLHAIGERDKPVMPLNIGADFGGGSLYLVIGVLAALLSRRSTGRGQVVDAAMVDGAASLMTMFYSMLGAGNWIDERRSNFIDGGHPYYDTYRCADGGFVAVGAIEPQFFAALVEGLGVELEGDQNDPAAWPGHRAAFEVAFLTKTRDEWDEIFRDTDACVSPVLSMAEAPSHPHNLARGLFAQVGPRIEPRTAPKFSATPLREPVPPEIARAGSARAVLGAWGLESGEIGALLDSGAIGDIRSEPPLPDRTAARSTTTTSTTNTSTSSTRTAPHEGDTHE